MLNDDHHLLRTSDEKELEGCSMLVPINGDGLTSLDDATVASERRDTSDAPAVQAWDLEHRGITKKVAGSREGELLLVLPEEVRPSHSPAATETSVVE